MTTYDFYAYAGAAIAAGTYIFICKGVLNRTQPQNFMTYFLWGLLDTINAVPAFQQHGNWILPATYVVLAVAVCICILHVDRPKLGWVEVYTAFLVLACVVAWKTNGGTAAIIASTVAVCCATIPLAWDSWKQPFESPLGCYAFFTLANGVSIFAGHDWSIKERFYSGTCTLLTAFVVLLIFFRRVYLAAGVTQETEGVKSS